ncbi:Syntaxin-18 [Lamellibrachia satsuma]|nr:Syntaxin-18 [Lamellibrachia satsuma]
MRGFLLEHRTAYIDVVSYLGSEGSRMTDSERDQIDTEAESFMKTCSEAIRLFKQECNLQKVFLQVKEHRGVVFSLIQDYLKTVCQVYSEQRAIRVKRVVDRKRLARLEPEKKRRSHSTFVSQLKHTESDGKKTTHEKKKVKGWAETEKRAFREKLERMVGLVEAHVMMCIAGHTTQAPGFWCSRGAVWQNVWKRDHHHQEGKLNLVDRRSSKSSWRKGRDMEDDRRDQGEWGTMNTTLQHLYGQKKKAARRAKREM